MGIRITDDKIVALFDSVTGIPFGDTFIGDGILDGADEAEAFLEWVNDDGRDLRNPRVYDELRKAWNDHGRPAWEALHADSRTEDWVLEAVPLDAESAGIDPDYEAAYADSLPGKP